MQYKKLTNDQRSIKRWRAKRNRIYAELLAKDRMLMRDEAMRQANRLAGPMPRGK